MWAKSWMTLWYFNFHVLKMEGVISNSAANIAFACPARLVKYPIIHAIRSSQRTSLAKKEKLGSRRLCADSSIAFNISSPLMTH